MTSDMTSNMTDKSIPRAWLWPLLIIVALIQSAALFKMVYDRDALLKTGREITIATQPLDPRDIFRGDYVTLGYDISTLRGPISSLPQNGVGLRRGATLYVTLTPNTGGGWKVGRVTAGYPDTVATSDVVLQGRVRSFWRDESKSEAVVGLRYGIEYYFVPEGTGRDLEKDVRERKVEAIVSIDNTGTAALKGLVVNGERHVDPPLL